MDDENAFVIKSVPRLITPTSDVIVRELRSLDCFSSKVSPVTQDTDACRRDGDAQYMQWLLGPLRDVNKFGVWLVDWALVICAVCALLVFLCIAKLVGAELD